MRIRFIFLKTLILFLISIEIDRKMYSSKIVNETQNLNHEKPIH